MIVTPIEMQEIEQLAIGKYGMPSIVLMENAAHVFSDHVASKAFKKVLIVVGPGNNGGDGLAIARHLHEAGVRVRILVTCTKDKFTADALVNYNLIKDSDIKIKFVQPTVESGKYSYSKNSKVISEQEKESLASVIAGSDLVIDAIFGIGLNREVVGLEAEIIKLINNFAKCVYSVDVPSGINALTGQVMGVAVRSQVAITFGYAKCGMLTGDALDYYSEYLVAKIALPPMKEVNDKKYNMKLFNLSRMKEIFVKRATNTNKGTFGKVLIIGGSNEMRGAVAFGAKAALAGGAGLVYVATTQKVWNTVAKLVPDSVAILLGENEKGGISVNNKSILKKAIDQVDSIVIGPGMGNSDETYEIVKYVVENSEAKPVILDADALNVFAKEKGGFNKVDDANVIVTPHPGEMARLMGIDVESVQRDRIGAAKKFSKEHNVVTVLKGAGTVVASRDGGCYINSTGNAGMAVAGMGDVLAGLCGAFAVNMSGAIDKRIAGAVYIHGRAGDKSIESHSRSSLTANMLIKNIDAVLKEVEE